MNARFVEWFAMLMLGVCTSLYDRCLVELSVPPSVGRAQLRRRRRGSVIREGLAGIVSPMDAESHS